jgi:hypothetical protein
LTSQNARDRQQEPIPTGSGRPEHKAHIRPLPDVLDVVAVVSNPARYRTRYDLFRAFEAHVQDSGARLTVVELAFGRRPFEVTQANNPRHVQLRSDHEFWAKENLINLGIARLPSDSRYIAWVDADLTFARHDWVQETLQQLQHYPIVQMFAEAHDLDPDGLILNTFRSFGYSHVHGVPRKKGAGYYGGTPVGPPYHPRVAYWHHPGFAWAARREAIDALGGLFDVAVVGEADYIMAKAIVGEAEDVLYPGVSSGYRKAVADWQSRALTLRGNYGFVPGTVLHHWHGRKSGRKYWDRCKILTDSQFDPSVDLKRDWQGLYQLVDHHEARSILLRDAIRSYFRSRNEDGIDA